MLMLFSGTTQTSVSNNWVPCIRKHKIFFRRLIICYLTLHSLKHVLQNCYIYGFESRHLSKTQSDACKKNKILKKKKLLAYYLIMKVDGFLLSKFKLNFLLLNYEAV